MKNYQFKVSIFNYYKKEKSLLSIFLLASSIVMVLDLLGPYLAKILVDDVLPLKNNTLFLKVSIILFVVYIARLFLAIISHGRGQLLGSRIKYHMKNDLYKKMLSMNNNFFNKNHKGDLIARLTSDLESSSALIYKGLEDTMFTLLALVGSFIMMLKFNLTLAMATISPLPFIILFVYIKNKSLRNGYTNIRKTNGILTSEIHDTFKTIFFIKDNSLEYYKNSRFNERNSKLLEDEKTTFLNIAYLMSGIAFYNNITQLIIICTGGYLFIQDRVSMGIIISFLLLTNRFRVYLMKLMGLIDTYQKGMTGISRFKEIMEKENDPNEGISLDKNIDGIILKGLSFSYGEKKILDNVNISIKKGEKVAFVGESGVGKSTLLNLIKGSITPGQGDILINNLSLSSISKESYLEKIGIVDQNDSIMNVSIKENIDIINKSKKVTFKEAISRANLTTIIDKLSNKEDTVLGDKGVILSTGQQQRVALARLFIKSPSVILLDEATSTLDNISEFKIMENIDSHFSDSIVIAVAHRLNTIKDFDKIYLLEEGKIAESGSFNELLSNKDKFYRMHKGG